jgi:hypothetical protein
MKRKATTIILLVSMIISSCGSQKQKCDAYGCVEPKTEKNKS